MKSLTGILLALAFASACASELLEGKVVAIQDGDTLTIIDAEQRQHRIRLAGIDAPEKGQPFGVASRRALSDCAFSRQAKAQGEKMDRYGRLVAKVLAGAVDCNLRQVELGMAWHYKRYAREQPVADRRSYAEAEDGARERRIGLWQQAEPEAPWEQRSRRRQEAAR